MNLPNEIFPPNVRIEILAYRGSISHGMYVPNTDPNSIDDIDLMGVVVPSWESYFAYQNQPGHFPKKGTKEIFYNEWDTVWYEFNKFVGLLLKGNPNVISILWLKPEYYIQVDKGGQMLIDNRDIFSSRQVLKAFSGYAYAQLKKMEHYAHGGYMGKKRKTLVEKFGYDVKNAAHCIRLLRMGTEFAMSEELFVDRSRLDAKTLLKIKRGKYSLDQIKQIAKEEFEQFNYAFDRTRLPDRPDFERAKKIEQYFKDTVNA